MKRYVGGVKGVKHCTVILIKDQKTVCWRCLKCIQGPQYRAMLLMLEVSKVHRELSVQSNVTHVKGVESSSICTIRAVMLCMSKVLKVAQHTL